MASKSKKSKGERLTISFRAGQRKALQVIADENHTSLAFVIRYALDNFIIQNKERQLKLNFPKVLGRKRTNQNSKNPL